MNSNNTRPVIVAIEGADAVGKSTHVRAAVEHLRVQGINARAFHHAKPDEGDPGLDAIAYMEQRMALVASLAPGDVVVADRWFWSTIAFCLGRARDPACVRTRHGDSYTRTVAEGEARASGFDNVGTRFLDVMPLVVVNSPAPHVRARIAVVVLDAPDAVLDARLAGRGEQLLGRRYGERAFYRRATCIDTSTDEARTLVPRLLAWAVEGLRMGAL